MKKKWIGAMIILSSFISACSSVESLSTVEKNEIVWNYAGSLPAQKGFEQNVGVAGLLQGTIGDYIIVGGGANFPTPLEKGGKKVTHKDLYLLKDIKGQLVTLNQTQLPFAIGYGASVDVKEENAIYYLGGSPEGEHGRDILKVTLNGEKIEYEIVGKMPLAFQNGVAQYRNGKIYYGVGKFENKEGKLKNGNKFFYFDIKTKKIKELSSFPGEARQQTVGQILNDKFYVFSGGSNVSYVDGYAYDFATDTWSKAADVVVNGEKIMLLGANSVKVSNDKMLVIGGFNYKLWNDANYYLSTLKGDKLKEYKENYFGAEPDWYRWNRKVLVYNANTNTWTKVGEVPFNAPCGEALVKVGENIYSINGEIKPGVRTDRMFKGIIISK